MSGEGDIELRLQAISGHHNDRAERISLREPCLWEWPSSPILHLKKAEAVVLLFIYDLNLCNYSTSKNSDLAKLNRLLNISQVTRLDQECHCELQILVSNLM